MKKLMTAMFASVLALALAAPAAFACPGHDDDTKVAKEQDESGVIAQEDKKAGEEKKAEEAPKIEKKEQPKVAKAPRKAQQKKPVRVSQK